MPKLCEICWANPVAKGEPGYEMNYCQVCIDRETGDLDLSYMEAVLAANGIE